MTNDLQNGHRKRLKEKFSKAGFAGLHDYEQIELLLMYAIPRRDVKPVARELLTRFKTLPAILNASLDELCETKGIGHNAAILIKTVKELCCEYLASDMIGSQITLSTPDSVKDFIRMKLSGLKDENFLAIYLDNSNHVITYETLSKGTVNFNVVYPRNLVKSALLNNASGIIVIHNHPSGSTSPSHKDIELTKSLKEAVETVNIRLLDHLIVAGNNVVSFVEKGLL